MACERQDNFDIRPMHELLVRLGVTANYMGFQQCTYAVCLCVQNPDRLSMVTKWLYPDVAKHFCTTSGAVERNLRYVVKQAWERNPAFLREISKWPVFKKPTVSQFLALLVYYFLTSPHAA